MAALLAVDLGVRGGVACYGDDGRLRWYRSQNFGGAPRPTSLRHDAADAIMIGLWGVLSAGWLRRLPDLLRR